ncbi:MmcQ/YjbR family DNA-binding protein [Cellulomonas fengjieae]|uniref:MmcQ/YjbR family DNA-binding protein n=1 Tax=Cellulomonas fengjieae TaxID=2819978 RepID=A0ABS3SCB2_9CELL|nr:MmcQ/YjbR family DNA-binding protein [Cellulomonas fengjieae]MBO3083377.1 MmcQ/YjbR family DNA-binding protein [Cellulomonas fengjieae]QVI65281.1 MmcQ/YjbR family DNA-binding protein [Cellulomonas fengjieae]
MDLHDVRRSALALPEVAERQSWGQPAWFHRNLVARMWDADRLTVRVEDDGERLALVEQDPSLYSSTDHHAGTNLVLIALDVVAADDLSSHLAESWWWAAPPVLRRRYPDLGPPPEA